MAARTKTRWQSGETFLDKWTIIRLIGEGGFGSVYEVEKLPTSDRYALKIQLIPPRPIVGEVSDPYPTHAKRSRLKIEIQVLRAMRASGFARAHCKYFEWGFTEQLTYMITAVGGPDLQEMKKRLAQRRFSLRSALFLAEKVLESIHELHRVGFIHRDVKPQNFVIGREGDGRSVYMIDTGMARRWVQKKTTGIDYDRVEAEIRPPRPKSEFHGSMRYASLTTHRYLDMSRVDDLWSWFFMLIEFTVNSLPWIREVRQPIVLKREKLKLIKVAKEHSIVKTEKILDGCPHEYREIYVGLKSWKFFDAPDYKLISATLRGITSRKQYTDVTPLDWEAQADQLQLTPAEKTILGSVQSKKVQ